MPDSPKCKKCKMQTFKVAGKALFHCHGCLNYFPKDSFNPQDFEWRTNGTR